MEFISNLPKKNAYIKFRSHTDNKGALIDSIKASHYFTGEEIVELVDSLSTTGTAKTGPYLTELAWSICMTINNQVMKLTLDSEEKEDNGLVCYVLGEGTKRAY